MKIQEPALLMTFDQPCLTVQVYKDVKKYASLKLRKVVMGISALFFAAWTSSPSSFSIEN